MHFANGVSEDGEGGGGGGGAGVLPHRFPPAGRFLRDSTTGPKPNQGRPLLRSGPVGIISANATCEPLLQQVLLLY